MMTERNLEKITGKLFALIKLRRLAGQQLADGLGMKPEEVFHEYQAGHLPSRGTLPNGIQFFFHGLECAVKLKDGSTTELEFGPHGRYDAFDKYTICHELGYPISNCERVISKLVEDGIITLADKELFEFINRRERVYLETEPLESDVLVADRYVIKDESMR